MDIFVYHYGTQGSPQIAYHLMNEEGQISLEDRTKHEQKFPASVLYLNDENDKIESNIEYELFGIEISTKAKSESID